ncbi:hypothetical protein D3C87_1222430 [compost metagenome]
MHAVRARDVGSEVDPPGHRHALRAGSDTAGALAPQPVAHRSRADLAAQRAPRNGGARVAVAADQVAANVAVRAQQQIAAVLRIPGLVQAGGPAVDQVLEGFSLFAEQQRTVPEHAARLVVGIDPAAAGQRG